MPKEMSPQLNLFITSTMFIFKRESTQPDLHDDSKLRFDFVHILIGKSESYTGWNMVSLTKAMRTEYHMLHRCAFCHGA